MEPPPTAPRRPSGPAAPVSVAAAPEGRTVAPQGMGERGGWGRGQGCPVCLCVRPSVRELQPRVWRPKNFAPTPAGAAPSQRGRPPPAPAPRWAAGLGQGRRRPPGPSAGTGALRRRVCTLGPEDKKAPSRVQNLENVPGGPLNPPCKVSLPPSLTPFQKERLFSDSDARVCVCVLCIRSNRARKWGVSEVG